MKLEMVAGSRLKPLLGMRVEGGVERKVQS